MDSHQQFSLYWNNYVKHITNAFDKLRCEEDLVDVTLSCEGKRIRAHKMLLSACSTYFKELFKENPCQHPVIIFRNVKHEDLTALVEFMYKGEVNVNQDQLSSFLMTAEMLAVQGLSGSSAKDGSVGNEVEEILPSSAEREPEIEQSKAVWQEKGTHNPSIAGTSAASPSPYFLERRNSESPPASKRRKRRGNTPTKEVKHETSATVLDDDCDSNPIEITEPLVPTEMKLETVKYDNDIYVDPNLEMNAPVKSEKDQLQAVSQLLGHDLSDMYSNNSQVSSQQQPAEKIALDINQMLQKAGPSSVDNQSQDLIQDYVQYQTYLMQAKERGEEVIDEWNHETSRYVCHECGAVYKSYLNLVQHKNNHPEMTPCKVCGMMLLRRALLGRHMLHIHGVTLID